MTWQVMTKITIILVRVNRSAIMSLPDRGLNRLVIFEDLIFSAKIWSKMSCTQKVERINEAK